MNIAKSLIIRCFLLIVSLMCYIMPAFAQKSDTLNLMTYNIRFGELASMESIAAYIISEKSDIVALQECDWNTHRGNASHQNGVEFINELAFHTGMFGIYGKAINFSGGYYGIGLLSRYPIVSHQRVLLPNDGKTEQRVMLVADIELPSGEIITFVNTHLEVKSSELRIEQIRFINEYLKDSSDILFLAGDMNASPDSEEIGFLNQDWQCLTDMENTFPASSPRTKLDYIYVRKGNEVETVFTDARENVALSDHLPVVSAVVLR